MVFTLPESYAAYATQKEVRTAVDHILDSRSLEVPPDLDWDQLPDFHAAVLAAHQVRCEYASAIQRLWNDTWRATLCLPGLELETCTIASTREYAGESNTAFNTARIWDGEEFYRHFLMRGYRIALGVELNSKEARLWFWLGDESEKNNTGNLLKHKSYWHTKVAEDDDLYGYSNEGLAPISGGNVETDQLKAAAEEALTAVRHIRETWAEG